MNSSQKEVQQAHLNEEKNVIRQLKQVYSQAIEDCEQKIAALNARKDMQNLQSIIYQRQYQTALESQLSAALANLQANEYQSVSEYLTNSYTNGYTGAIYDIQKQTGCTILTPINQSAVVAALQTDSKLSTSLYTKLGEDITQLKKSIQTELSRGIANGSSWLDIAAQVASGMNSPYKTALNNAIRIARTEGHRVQQQSQLDALKTAADEGADVVKQWDATLDSRTRPDHRAADGQLRELDEKFRVGGEDMEAPGIGGSARNVCNCRCCLLQRARWALDEDELETLKQRAAYYGLDKTSDFEDFKNKYLKISAVADTIKDSGSETQVVSGALNPNSKRAGKHAEQYYEAVRKMNTDVERIAKNTGIAQTKIKEIKNFVFMEKHDLGEGKIDYFDASYEIAQSWQRLIDGKNIQPHDITMLRHEIMERELMLQGLTQDEAHIKTSRVYNYQKESEEYYDKVKKHKKG